MDLSAGRAPGGISTKTSTQMESGGLLLPPPHSDLAKPTAKKEGPGTSAPGHSKGRKEPMELGRAVAACGVRLTQLEASEGGAWRRNREMEIEQWRKTRKRRRKSERHRRKWGVKGMRATCTKVEVEVKGKRGENEKRDDILR
jgi:hypothetical protein